MHLCTVFLTSPLRLLHRVTDIRPEVLVLGAWPFRTIGDSPCRFLSRPPIRIVLEVDLPFQCSRGASKVRYTTSMGFVVRKAFGVNATVHWLPIMRQPGGNGDGYPEDVMVSVQIPMIRYVLWINNHHPPFLME